MLLSHGALLCLTGTSLSLLFCALLSLASLASLAKGSNSLSTHKMILASAVSKADTSEQEARSVYSRLLKQVGGGAGGGATATAGVTHRDEADFMNGSENISVPYTKQDEGYRSSDSTWYDTAGWLPKKGFYTDRKVNLAVLPMLAFIIFVFGVCVKCYSWMRDHDRRKARGTLDFEDDEQNYTIITEGEQGYREVDFRSDTTSMYDTLTSFRSMRLPCNENTVTSVRSLPNQPFEPYRSILIQRLEGGVYASVHSYKAFLQKSIETKDFDIEVELVKNYNPCRSRSKSYDAVTGAAARSRRRRMRRHSGGQTVHGRHGTQSAKERVRHHSEKIPPHRSHVESLRRNTFHRQSSPALFEPLLEGATCLALEQNGSTAGAACGEATDAACGEATDAVCVGHRTLSSSSSDSSHSKMSVHKPRRERPRVKRASQDKLMETAKGSSHSSGHSSDESPKSLSSSSDDNSSNEVNSDSDVTDSGLVVESNPLSAAEGKSDKQQANGNILTRAASRKVHRFKVSFVDDDTLDTSLDLGGK